MAGTTCDTLPMSVEARFMVACSGDALKSRPSDSACWTYSARARWSVRNSEYGSDSGVIDSSHPDARGPTRFA
ncbi:hypothetical protein GCM10027404_18010 [Arthrobacter tumbae]